MHEGVRLYQGDCLELMPYMAPASIDLIFTDLPYGTTRCKWDTCVELKALWACYIRLLKPKGAVLLFAQTPFDKVLGTSNLDMLRYEWVWEKTRATGHLNANRMPMKAHENILVFYKKLPTYNPQKTRGHPPANTYTKRNLVTGCYGEEKETSGGGQTSRYPRSVLRYPSDTQKSKLIETQKPVALLAYLISTYTNAGDRVFDSCMGSGSTGVATIKEDRLFTGVELTPAMFKIAESRINKQGLLK